MVADFRSPVGDSTLGATVAEAIRTDLTQSCQPERHERAATGDLQLMQKAPGTSLEFETAREVATREGAKALLDGSVEHLGPSYIVSARLVSALDGTELATFRATADTDGELIAALGGLAKDVRERVGESLKSIRETKALERVTTSSLPALRKYVEGMFALDGFADRERGQALLYEATALDSTFAMAWRRIAAAYSGQGGVKAEQIAAIENDYRFRDRLSDNERLVTEAGYYSFGPTPDLDRTIAAYEALLERDSVNTPALNNVGLRYSVKRDYARSEALLQHAIALPNPFGGSFGNLAQAQLAQGKFAAAESTSAQFEKVLPSNAGHWQNRMYIQVGRGDYAATEKLAREVFADPKRATQRDFAALSLGSEPDRGRCARRCGGSRAEGIQPPGRDACPSCARRSIPRGSERSTRRRRRCAGHGEAARQIPMESSRRRSGCERTCWRSPRPAGTPGRPVSAAGL